MVRSSPWVGGHGFTGGASRSAPDGYFVRLNPAWESGYTRDELKAKCLFDLAEPDDVGLPRRSRSRSCRGHKGSDGATWT